MKNLKPLLFCLILFLSFSCSITKNQKKGTVLPQNFNFETEFTTAKSVIILPFEIDGISKNFLFDTGADFSIIQRDSTIGRTGNYDGASNRKMKLGTEYVKSIKIGNIDPQKSNSKHSPTKTAKAYTKEFEQRGCDDTSRLDKEFSLFI